MRKLTDKCVRAIIKYVGLAVRKLVGRYLFTFTFTQLMTFIELYKVADIYLY